MTDSYFETETFERVDYTIRPFRKGEYDGCSFLHCDFSRTDITDCSFLGCRFVGCNLSLANITGTSLRAAQFKDCKMLGLRFDTCKGFGLEVGFSNCSLNHSSFHQVIIKKTLFKKTILQEVDFSACDLTGSVFDECDLAGAIFDKTILEKTDFRTAFNFSINPETNRIKKARFSVAGTPGLLHKYDILID